MLKNSPNLMESRVSGTGSSLLILVGFVLIGMAVGNLLAVWLLTAMSGTDLEGTADLINQLMYSPANVPDGWYMMMLFQGMVHFFSYLLPSLLFIYWIERRNIRQINTQPELSLQILILALLVVLLFIPLNGKFIEWNQAMKFPDAFSGIERWMREKESQMEVLTKFLTTYDQFGQLLIAMVVVVLLPAAGEEFIFRGIIQRKLAETWNIHIAIWTAAAIFSAIHFQFYGFLPRMLLGALFGYLYYWSGNIWVAVLAHFVNNGFVLLMVYLYNVKVLEINIEETKTMPILTVFVSLLSTLYVLYRINRAGKGLRDIKQN
ncbi:CPBP family intramembrane glutamic endopeptidase [Dyadobacter tibetensis]|uniref:CPBP family intramembrane glutamic endopeptidase n=1 Tax=Dyadobacter tibetensis TaxID=1211851 RepID=UPI00046FE45C|nr:CPBP family intramembrane glutamic endopeptidase [Dyadobacter tibetensis]